MPQTTKQVENAAKNPAFCSLIPLLELVDNYEVLRHGPLSALYRVSPLNSYFESDEERNEASEALHALLRTMPDNRALRLQVRYETTQGVGALLDNFEQQLRSRHSVLAALDREQLKTWRERDDRGDFLKRHYTLGFQLDPRLYTLLDESFGKSTDLALLSRFLPGYQIQRSYEEHERIRSIFESLLAGYQSLLTLAGLRYERLTTDDLALELLRTLNPLAAYRRPWRPELGNRSLREWICDVGIEDEGPGWQQMNGLLYVVCGIRFDAVYGPELAKSYIEIHHAVSISKLDGRAPNIDHLVPLCANCHRMAHRRLGEIVPIQELKDLYESRRSSRTAERGHMYPAAV